MEEEVRIERLNYGSAGVGRCRNGKTVFVDGTAPGDIVHIQITEEKPRYCKAELLEIVEASPFRVNAPCPYYGVCGGCSWQHLDYHGQLEAKTQIVIDSLSRIAHFDLEKAAALVQPTRASKREFGYRNKLELNARLSPESINAEGFELGFIKEQSNEMISIDSCLIAQNQIQKAPHALRGALRYLQGSHDLGVFRVGVRQSLRTKDLEVALWTNPGSFPRKIVGQTLKSALNATSIVRVIADEGKTRRIKQVEVLDGKGFWEEQLGAYRYKTSAPSFFQINTAQAEEMISEIMNTLNLDQDSTVADLYAGGGTFSLPLASQARRVLAVESASTSVKDLRRNAQENRVSIEVIGGDSARELPNLGRLDALLVDPPRTGLAKGVVADIASCGPAQVVYVSCDPSTWSRDVALFLEQGYELNLVQPFDLFPQTYHVEIVSVFSRSAKNV